MSFVKDHPTGTRWLAGFAIVLLSAFVLSAIHYLGGTSSFRDSLTIWTMTTILLFVLTNVGFYLLKSLDKTLQLDAALVFSIFWSVAAALAMISTIFFLFPDPHDAVRQAHAFLSLAAGCVLGWALGMYISPKDSSERSEFAKIGAAVAGLASGYTLKGIQTWIFQTGNQHYQIYCFIVAISALLTAATIYNVRAYSNTAVRIAFDHADPADADRVAVTTTETVSFKAAVVGPEDTSVLWEIIPNPIQFDQAGNPLPANVGAIARNGTFTPALPVGIDNAKCRIKAISIGNPGLCSMVDVTITRVSLPAAPH